MYLAGREKDLAKRRGVDDAFMSKVEKNFGVMMLYDRRLLKPQESNRKTIGKS